VEPDISILRKTGHFYFALTRICSVWKAIERARKFGSGLNALQEKYRAGFGANASTLGYNNLRLGEDDGFVAVNKDAVFNVPAHSA